MSTIRPTGTNPPKSTEATAPPSPKQSHSTHAPSEDHAPIGAPPGGGDSQTRFLERQGVDSSKQFKATLLGREAERKSGAETARGVAASHQVTAKSSPEELLADPRVRSMLDVIATTEGTGDDYGRVANGVVIESHHNQSYTGRKDVSVKDLSRHPDMLVRTESKIVTSAAGRYQFLTPTWEKLDMPDFSPHSQDIGAVKLMQQRHMIEPLLRGDLSTAVSRGAEEWASLPKAGGGSRYHGQRAADFGDIKQLYNDALTKHQARAGVASDETARRLDPAVRSLPDAAAHKAAVSHTQTHAPHTNHPQAAAPQTPSTNATAAPKSAAPPADGEVQTYRPYTVYSTTDGNQSRQVNHPGQLLPHHDLHRTMKAVGPQVEVRDVTLTHGKEPTEGQVVPSPLEGRVVWAGDRHDGYGNSVKVVNDRTKQTYLIAHLDRVNVRTGESIKYGQNIGRQGDSGTSEGTHVHIEASHGVIDRWVTDLLDGRFDARAGGKNS